MLNNLLNMALNVIPSQAVKWHRYAGETLNEAGYPTISYDDPVEISGSWQSVDMKTVKEMGLDMSKSYKQLYTSNNVKGTNRGTNPDRIEFNGAFYSVVGDADWYDQDGWKSIVCVREQDEED